MMKELIWFLVVFVSVSTACAEPNSGVPDGKKQMQKRRNLKASEEIELAVRRLKRIPLEVQAVHRESLTVMGIGAEKWELVLKSDKSIRIFVYSVKTQSDAKKIAPTLSKGSQYAISGPSLLVVQNDHSKASVDIERILSAYSGEEE